MNTGDQRKNNQDYWILSVDGGGMRGVIAAQILSKIESEILKPQGKSLHSSFDMFVGTSAGAINAAALASGKTAEEIVEVYKENGEIIFPSYRKKVWPLRLLFADAYAFKRLFNFLCRFIYDIRKKAQSQANNFLKSAYHDGFIQALIKLIGQLILHPKYANDGLKKVLEDSLKSQPGEYQTFADLRDKKIRLLITAYDTDNREPLIFDSNDKRFENVKLWEAVVCSASAPTYFPAYSLDIPKNDESEKEEPYSLIDGGLIANNPAALAVSYATDKKRALQNIKVLSIGTGDFSIPLSYEEAEGMSRFEWLLSKSNLFDFFTDGHADVNELMVKSILPRNDLPEKTQYLRLQPKFSRQEINLSDARFWNHFQYCLKAVLLDIQRPWTFIFPDLITNEIDNATSRNIDDLIAKGGEYFDDKRSDIYKFLQILPDQSNVAATAAADTHAHALHAPNHNGSQPATQTKQVTSNASSTQSL